jgi:hypothetical protein
MLEFFLINIILIFFSGILYIIARSLPRINEENISNSKKNFLDRFIISDFPNKIDSLINFYIVKFFRKFKILLLRFDNYITEKLKKMNLDNNGDKKIDFNGLNGNGNNLNNKEFKKDDESSLI